MNRKLLALFLAVPAFVCYGATGKTESERQFADKVAQQSLGEKNISQMAENKAASSRVKGFATQSTRQSQDLENYLHSLASTHGINLPNQMSKRDQRRKARLSKLSGNKFDRAYMQEQVKAYREALSAFKHEANHGKTAAGRNLAKEAIPTLRADLHQAQTIRGSLRG